MKTTISLNGTWKFLADLDPKYHAIHGGFQNPDANRRHWLKVPVPGVWQKYGERYDIYEGVCWFHRTFNIEKPDKNTIVKLRFGAVNYLCHIFINGQEVGSHETGYTEFAFDITEYLQDGENQIAVQVDNRAAITKWPPCLGYFNYGGIHRNVSIKIMDGPSLGELRIEAIPGKNGKGKLCIKGNIINSTQQKLKVIAVINEQKQVISVENESFELTNCSLDDIIPWSPETPQLYDLKLSLMSNEETLD
ncbi:MAG: beta galactosidase jelly roll domain-containing protein, partial [Victivallaceae bacterium]|nr:beta galactosidase jelly roll domain-containing protein [Victivallaceae bacterium]